MDPDRFDALVQSLAAPGSRRRLLGGVLAGAAAPLIAAAKSNRHRAKAADASAASNGPQPAACLAVGKRCTLPASAAARHGQGKGKHGKGKHHPPSCDKCCTRFGAAGSDGKARCTCKGDGEACANPSQCCGGLCPNGHCTGCPGNLTACNGNCVDLQTNAQHCGDCATRCASGQRCVAGNCVCDGTSCPRGCCANDGSCQRGTSDQACGIDGAECQACGTCTTCDGTTCVNAAGCCGDASVCQNGMCIVCHDGQRCQTGQCVCDATSCPNGCCNGATCVPFAQQTNQQCGTNGAACAACTGYDTCGGGGTNGVCGCTATTCKAQGKNCGSISNGCGVMLDCGTCSGYDTCGGGNPSVPNVCGCTPKCDGKPCDADNECGGTCPCPGQREICHHNSEDDLVCCCSNDISNPRCIANEDEPTRLCCCSIFSLPPPRCLFSESGAQCCCGNPLHICTDAGCQPPPA